MNHPVNVTQESGSVLEFGSQLGFFGFNKMFNPVNSDGCSSFKSNYLYFNYFVGSKRPRVTASLSLSGSSIKSIWCEFNRVARFHCERIPIRFASVRLNSSDTNGLSDNGNGFPVKEGLPLNCAEGEKPKRVLILMSDTGGGHRASAEAIKVAFNEEFGDSYQVFITDLWSEHTPWPFNQLPRSYNFLVKHGPLWKMTYYGTAPRIIHQSNLAATSTFIARFHNLVTRCYCPTAEVSRRALRAGLQLSQIKVYGLPMRPSFVKPVRPKVKEWAPIEATARALWDSLYDENLGEPIGQVLVICGRNKKLASRLQAIDWKIPVEVKGFVTKMEECMGACDCIITKAGPGTIAEAMIQGLPIILNGYIAGQEAGNVPYVVENGCGKFSKSPKEIAGIVAQWFGPKADELKAMAQNSLKLARPDAVFKIVHDLHELVRQRNYVARYSCTAYFFFDSEPFGWWLMLYKYYYRLSVTLLGCVLTSYQSF